MSGDNSLATFEQAVKQIKSVIAARINANPQGEIEEIHVLAHSGRNPKQIVRDVESILAAQFGLQVDHKKISVAQVEEDEESSTLLTEFRRPKLIGVTWRMLNSVAEVKVELLLGEQVLEGRVEGLSSSYNKLRLCVEATLKALAPLTLDKCIFVPEDVIVTPLAKHQVAQVALTLITSSGEQTLVGCALIRSDDREAVVRATLDAVNRKLRFLTLG